MSIDSSPVPAVPTLQPLLEVAHVAHRLSASPEFVRRLLRDGKIAGIRFGKRWRIEPRDLQAFIERQRRGVTAGPLVDRRQPRPA